MRRRIGGHGIGVLAVALVVGGAAGTERRGEADPGRPEAAHPEPRGAANPERREAPAGPLHPEPAPPVVPARTGSLRGIVSLQGTVRYDGQPARALPVDMSSDPYCAQASAGAPAAAQPVDVAAGGGLRGVVVHVRENVPTGPHPVPAQPVLLDQQGCAYRPGVVALRAGQPLLIRNSDETMHNVHARSKANREFNIGQPIRGLESKRTFVAPEVGIAVSCDIHSWMGATIAVFDHPFFAVTDADGAFLIDGLPPGEYLVEAWHPTLGARTQRVSVPADGAAQTTFAFAGTGT